jgi:transposase
MPLKVRIYECNSLKCGHVEDRDVNAAYQIAFREFDLKKQGKVPKKFKNGVLPRRGVKSAEEILPIWDLQARPTFKPRDLSRGAAAQV